MWTRCQLRPGLAVLKGTSSPDVQPEGVGGAWGLILPWMGSQGVGWGGVGVSKVLGHKPPPPPWTLLGHAAACPFFPARGHGELVPLRVSEDQGPHRGKLSCPGVWGGQGLGGGGPAALLLDCWRQAVSERGARGGCRACGCLVSSWKEDRFTPLSSFRVSHTCPSLLILL